MGYVKDNLLTKGFSGRIGEEIVFRQVNGRTIFCKRPRKRETFTPNQEVQRTHFQQAVFYAQAALTNRAMREDYALAAKQASIRGAYLAAIKDYLLEPKIAKVQTAGYKGNAGDSIVVIAVDHFKIVEALVTIKLANDLVLETGHATRNEFEWAYITQQANANLYGARIIVTVRDRLNKAVKTEIVL